MIQKLITTKAVGRNAKNRRRNSTCNAEFKKKLFPVMIPAMNANIMHSFRIHHTLNRSFII
jgi:hypothetical protein